MNRRQRDETLEDRLLRACSQENACDIAYCLEKGADFSRICSSGRTPLGIAAELGNTNVLKLLLGYKNSTPVTEPSASSNLGYFVMVHSESNDNMPDTRLDDPFLKGINFDDLNDSLLQRIPGLPDRGSIFDHADIMPDLEWDSEIDEADDNLFFEAENDPWAANYLWYASILSRTGELLADDASEHNSIDGEDQYGFTALHYAVSEGHTSIVNMLAEAGCKINAEDSDNFTPLHLAASKQRVDIIQLLVSMGGNPHHRSTDGITALHVAASRGLLQNVQALVTAGANVNAVDISDRTPLYLAVSRRQHTTVDYLIQHGAKVNLEEIHGYTPLFEAVCAKDVELVKKLLSAGAKLTQSHHLLHYAILHRQEYMVKVLVKAGAIVNLRNESGDTPLMLAVRTNSKGAVRILLQNGAVVHAGNHVNRQTALLDAIGYINRDCQQFSEMFSLFEEFGWNWKEERNALSYAITHANDHAVVTLVRRWNILTDECLLERNEMLNLLLLRNNKFLVELFIYAGFNLSSFIGCTNPSNEWFSCFMRYPLSLQQLSRIRIRTALKGSIHYKLDHLFLPQRLKSYLMFGDMPCPCETLPHFTEFNEVKSSFLNLNDS